MIFCLVFLEWVLVLDLLLHFWLTLLVLSGKQHDAVDYLLWQLAAGMIDNGPD